MIRLHRGAETASRFGFLAVILLILPACAPKVVGPLRLVFENPESERRASAHPGPFTVSVQLLEGEERHEFVARALGRETNDPIDAYGARTPLLTVLAKVVNESPAEMVFNPQNIVLVTMPPDYLHPLDETDAYEALRDSGLPADQMMRDITRLIFESPSELRPGEKMERLLVYSAPTSPVRRVRLDFSFFSIGGVSYSFTIPMRQVIGPAAR